MGQNKSAYLRYRVINRCLLRTNLKWTWRELAEACGNELRDFYGDNITDPSERTIKNDITDMDSLYGEKADLIRKNGKDLRLVEYNRAEKTYYYTDRTFSIDKVNLSKEQEKAIMEAVDLLKQFSNMPFYKHFSNAIGKVSLIAQETFDYEKVIDFEQNNDYSGLKNIQPLYDIIKNREEVIIWYRPFGTNETYKIKHHPYLLKEFKNRWFVIGWSPDEDRTSIFGLSRIIKIEKRKENYNLNEYFNANEHFEDIIGISIEEGSKLTEKITLLFSPKRGQYILTKPIHKSQKILTNNKSEVKIQLKLKINRELITEILSFGDDVKIIEPESLKILIIQKYKDSLNLYNFP